MREWILSQPRQLFQMRLQLFLLQSQQLQHMSQLLPQQSALEWKLQDLFIQLLNLQH